LTSLSASAQKNFDSGTFGTDTIVNGLSAYGYTSYALNLNHRIRRAAVGLRYSESVVDAAQQFEQAVYFPFYRCQGGSFQPVVPGELPPTGCDAIVAVPGTISQVLNQTTYNKTWAGTLDFSRGRSNFGFTLSRSLRQYIGTLGGGEDRQTTLGGSWTLPLSGRSSTSLRADWSKAEAATQKSDRWSLQWSLAHQISPKVTSNAYVRHSEQDLNTATGTIKENSVGVQLGMTF
jgi:uncharacterized protein (PEP-CTERM system associated)